MVQLTPSIWLLAALATVALGQRTGPPTSCVPGMPLSVCSQLGLLTTSSTTTSSSHTSTTNSASTTNAGAASTTQALSSSGTGTAANSGNNGGSDGSSVTSSSAGPLMTEAKSASGSGMSSGEKIGVGVGVGVGVAAIAAIAAIFLIARRRKRNTYDANSRTARAMTGGQNAPTFVGGAAVGRSQSQSPSVYTPPDTPSNYSRQSYMGEGQEPVDATNYAAAQSRSRTPPRLSLNAPSTPEQEAFMPEQKAYFEEGARPSPIQANRAVSPVSASPMDGHPPSPLRDHEKW